MSVSSSSRCRLLSVVAFGIFTVILSSFAAFNPWSGGKDPKTCYSSCGKIGNITYPFRLKNDDGHCGLPSFELECVNNMTTLTLFAGKYYVKDINYERYQIQVIDAGVVEDTACSIPWNHLTQKNFDSRFSVPLTGENFYINGSDALTLQVDPYYSKSVVFLNCSDAVSEDPRYVEVNAGGCNSGSHIYAVMHGLTVMDIKVGCRVKVITLANMTHDRNVSYASIRKRLKDGFWLSWLSLICSHECQTTSGMFCSVNQTTLQMECKQPGYCSFRDTWNKHSQYCEPIGPRILGDILRYVKEVIKEFVKRIRDIKRPLSYSHYYEEDFIGQDVLPIFLVARYLFGVALLLGIIIYMWRRRHFSVYENIENFLLENQLNPIRYEYREIKKMTKGFKVKLGQGGFGSVYKGKLTSGLDVAIKMLNKTKDNGQEFVSEVVTIGRIHHVNVVGLIGYCVEGKRYALVYEYMSNGSLDKYVFSKEGCLPLNYEKTYEIALGIACGIEYLHRGCDMQILHFDIKPHNILLDDNFTPKVSDFGLAKLYPVKDGSVVLTTVRGTLGYMGPELFYKNIGGVSYKADVYSFGMLLMEMGSRRRNSNPYAENSSQNYFPFWVYDQFKEEKDIEIEDVSKDDQILVKKIFIVALWCIQLKPNDRPSMKNVVEMLEGNYERLTMPPKPSFYPYDPIGQDGGITFDQTSCSDLTSSKNNICKTTSKTSLENKA
ncbi:hypothetical protein VNO78_30714 [Psophocarpus tetragonolobus]|uniref:Protein kinase domain-containing protein n=1 Tax=Psophocarpus tetragonolobus TaxID=3891 RepID=A0AAN9RXA6_PSOTE